ncbi:flagellar protein FliS [Desulfuromonas versatilis]|uniref:Flagellar secretion chaperone FliS n=1 Tax=Desulfuromonas versatilis TaxID=2802975 RepID=A0ABM8I1N9_9BACT|nr:flagellar export chaperone FliS [Desulfuromonas versatilis]BCR06598.1 flagellar protein FliS [Desulfuromonas versatilis]
MNAYMNQYQANDVATSSPERLLIMMYDGAIRNVARAELAIEKGERAPKLEAISKAIAIITELSNTLDFEVGGEIAENLDGLYGFMTRELTSANLKNDPEPLKVVTRLLKDLRATWLDAIEAVHKEKAAATRVEERQAANGQRSFAAAY